MRIVVIVVFVLMVIGWMSNGFSLDSEPECSDVSWLNDEAYEKGQGTDLEAYLNAQIDLETALQDCADKGEEPDYG